MQQTTRAQPRVFDRLLAEIDRPFNAELGIVEVPDPSPHHPGDRLRVNRRLDVLSRMYARKQIDEAEYQAGVKWQSLYDQAAIGRVHSIDHTREVVDGGRRREPLTDRQRAAMRLLGVADYAVADRFGLDGWTLYRDVLEHGRNLTMVAQMREMDTKPMGNDMKFLGRLFRECLGEVAKALGHLEA